MQAMIPARYRALIYGVYLVAGLVIGSVQVGFSAASLDQPVALTVALAVYAYLGAGLGYTALTHTPRADVKPTGYTSGV